LFDKCIGHDRKFMEAYIEKGLIFFDKHQYPEALQVFKLAVEVEPTYADAWYYQGRCYESLGKPLDATTMYENALKYDPSLKEAQAALNRMAGKA